MDSPTIAPVNDDQELPSAAPPRNLYFNRELSWLAFNRRVLEEACNPAHPLLERLRFLSISGNNLDEFFMVRVAGLKGQQLLGVDECSADGMSPAQQLAAIAEEVDRLAANQQAVWSSLRQELARAGIDVIGSSRELDQPTVEWLNRHLSWHAFNHRVQE